MKESGKENSPPHEVIGAEELLTNGHASPEEMVYNTYDRFYLCLSVVDSLIDFFSHLIYIYVHGYMKHEI